ncbi:hypothetical protein [Nocardia sp. NPDC058705]|uniref:nSTAND1 domain-containing NTPase n=1 Tax=Nocardia sp. NPDC058705 TaxID=3346609 RepID=UPI0036C7FCFC
MTNSDTQSSSPRVVFAQRFADLYAAAGNPTLRRVASASERRMRGAQAGTPSPQRISDWKAGRNVPARFESLLPVVLTLVEMTEKAQRALPRTLADPHEWRRLWQESVTWTADAGTGDTCPYPGLRAYLPEEHTLFFGREQATAEFVELVSATTDVVVLIGASGAGKSSLLAAGLRPAIDLPAATMTPGSTPTAGLTAALTDDLRVLIVDQFEELFTLCQDEAERSAFLASLAELPDSLTVVLALRADFYEQCLHYPVLRNSLQHNSYLLGAMSMDEVAHAITGPAEAAGLTLEPGLEELVLTELRGIGGHLSTDGYDPGALPLLSHVMSATWQQREGRKLTVAGYRKTGGVAGSVAETAELAWGELTSEQQTAAQELLGSLVTVGQDGRDTRRTVDRAELLSRSVDPDASAEALEVLAASRLIALDAGSVQFSHEIVLTAWPRLHGWIDTDRVGHLVRQRLEHDASEWEAAKHDSALLYRGTRLDNANEHTVGAPIGPRVRAFLQASRRAARNGGRWRMVAVAVVFALLATGVIAVDRTRLADQRTSDRDYIELVAAAERTRTEDPSLSAQLALAAHRMRPNESTHAMLLNSQALPLAVTVPAHDKGITTLVERRADRLVAALDYEGESSFWNINTPERPQRLGTGLDIRADQLLFVPGSSDTITDGPSGIQLWDLARPEAPRLLHTFGTLDKQSIAVDPRGTGLAEIDAATLTFWNIGNRSHPFRTASIPMPSTGTERRHIVEYSPDGALLALGRTAFAPGVADTVEFWDVRDPDAPRPIGTPIVTAAGDNLRDLEFSPDSTAVAVGTYGSSGADSAESSRVELWQVSDPRRPHPSGTPIRIGGELLNSVTFHENGNVLALGFEAGGQLWNIADPTQPAKVGPDLSVSPNTCSRNPIAPCQGGPLSLIFLADEPLLAGAGNDGTLRIWSMPRSAVDVVSGTPEQPVFDRTGDRMAILYRTGAAVVWDTADPRRPVRLTTIPRAPGRSAPALSPDGRTLSFHDLLAKQRVVFALDDPRHPRPLTAWPIGDATQSMVQGDRMLLTGKSSIQMWDVTDRTAPRALGAPITELPGTLAGRQLSLDGARLAAVFEDSRSTWKQRFFRVIWNLDDPAHPVPSAETDVDFLIAYQQSQFLPDNRTLAVIGFYEFQLLAGDTRDPITDIIRTEIAPIISLSVAADGTQLSVSSDDGTTALWDISDPRAPRRRSGPIGPADRRNRKVLMHPAGKQLVFVTDNGQLGVWDLDPEQVAERICAATGSLLTEPVWRRQVPNVAYRPPCA